MEIQFAFDIERIIDDFVFMCFFVGNDFLPHLPSLRIREGAIDLMYMLYKHCLPKLTGYLTENCKLNMRNIDYFFSQLSLVEGELFRLRK
jgi:5'-3' exoribonuclease 2